MNNKQFKGHSTETKAKHDDKRTDHKGKTDDKVDRGGAKVGDMNGEAKKTKGE